MSSTSIDQVTTDGRVSVKNGDDQSIFMADFVEIGDRVLLSATSEWEQLQAPQAEEEAAATASRMLRRH